MVSRERWISWSCLRNLDWWDSPLISSLVRRVVHIRGDPKPDVVPLSSLSIRLPVTGEATKAWDSHGKKVRFESVLLKGQEDRIICQAGPNSYHQVLLPDCPRVLHPCSIKPVKGPIVIKLRKDRPYRSVFEQNQELFPYQPSRLLDSYERLQFGLHLSSGKPGPNLTTNFYRLT